MIFLFLLFYSLISNLAAELTVYSSSHDELAAVSTQDFYQFSNPYFNRTGYRAVMDLAMDDDSGTCTPQLAHPIHHAFTPDDDMTTIMVVTWKEGRDRCKLTTMSQLFPLAIQFSAMLQEKGYPPSNTLVIGLLFAYKGIAGNPLRERYRSISASVPDGTPPKELQVVLVPAKEWDIVDGVDDDHDKDIIMTVVQDPGPWNAVFQNIGWKLCLWALFIVDIGAALYAAYTVALAIKEKYFTVDLRSALFVLAWIGTVLYASGMVLRTPTYAYRMMEAISTFFLAVAFHMLLYLWSVFLMQLHRNKAIYAFQVIVAMSGTTVLVIAIYSIVMTNSSANITKTKHYIFFSYWLPAMQWTLGVSFAVFAVAFLRKRENAKISANTQSALTRLLYVALIGFSTYLIMGIINLKAIVQWQTTGGRTAAIFYIKCVACSVRGVSVLLILGIKKPVKRDTGSTATSSTMSGFSAPTQTDK
jgi:hypothetical protein